MSRTLIGWPRRSATLIRDDGRELEQCPSWLAVPCSGMVWLAICGSGSSGSSRPARPRSRWPRRSTGRSCHVDKPAAPVWHLTARCRRWRERRQMAGILLLRSETPSPVRSAKAALRPVIAWIRDRIGPRTSGPVPRVQSKSVATRWMPRCGSWRRSAGSNSGKGSRRNNLGFRVQVS